MNTHRTLGENTAVALFFILTLCLSLAIPLFAPVAPEIVPLLMVLVPALLAMLLTALTDGRRGVSDLLKKLLPGHVGWQWYAIALGLAFGVRLGVSLLAAALGWTGAIELNAWALPQYIIIGVFIVFGAVMEELGWRGYALAKLLNRHSALYAALLIGVVWGIVHLGLTLPGQMNAGSPWLLTILYIIGLSVVLTWFFVQTRGGLAVPILFHAGQSYLTFLNGGISPDEQLALLTVEFIALALILVGLYGVNLRRGELALVRQQDEIA